MPKFILIDQSILNIGGHHYEYAVRVLEAAARAGYEPILATHRRFKTNVDLPWQVCPIYKYGFWFTFRAPALYGGIRTLYTRVLSLWFLLKMKVAFSPIGFMWFIRADPLEFLRWHAVDMPLDINPYLLIFLGIWQIVFAALFDFLKTVVPFKSFLSRIGSGLFKLTVGTVRDLFVSRHAVLIWFTDILKVKQFASDTQTLLKKFKLHNGDVVFIPTLSHVEMLGVLECIQTNRDASEPTWHLLFRRELYRGSEPDYPLQDESKRTIRNSFLKFIDVLHNHNIFLYTDTEQLSAQYNRLGIVIFHTLPIPHTYPPHKQNAYVNYPLQITYLGDARAEKGYHYLPGLVQSVWKDYAETGKVKFAIQSNYNTQPGESQSVIARNQLEHYSSDKLVLFKESLHSLAYKDVLLNSDICLLLYDRDNYYARSSGILVEALSAGVPVLVPSGTWLAHQIVDQITCHHLNLQKTLPICKTRYSEDVRWRRHDGTIRKIKEHPLTNVTVGSGDRSVYCWLVIPPKVTDLMISFDFGEEAEGVFINVSVAFADQKGRQLGITQENIMSKGILNSKVSALFKIFPNASRIWIGFGTKSINSAVPLSNFRFDFFAAPFSFPLGKTGLIYTMESQLPNCLRNIIDHYEHYKAASLDFAASYFSFHNADNLLCELEKRVSSTSKEGE